MHSNVSYKLQLGLPAPFCPQSLRRSSDFFGQEVSDLRGTEKSQNIEKLSALKVVQIEIIAAFNIA
jgi:hypothetical protein